MITYDNLWIIVNYYESIETDDLNNYLKDNGIKQELPDNIDNALKFLEINNLTDHIIYNILRLKKELK